MAAEVVLVGVTMSSNEIFSSKIFAEPRPLADPESPILLSTLEMMRNAVDKTEGSQPEMGRGPGYNIEVDALYRKVKILRKGKKSQAISPNEVLAQCKRLYVWWILPDAPPYVTAAALHGHV